MFFFGFWVPTKPFFFIPQDKITKSWNFNIITAFKTLSYYFKKIVYKLIRIKSF